MLTSFDRWLRARFLLRTHIYTLRLPPKVPFGVKVNKLSEEASAQFRFRLVAKTEALSQKAIIQLNNAGLMYKTQVVESRSLMARIIAPGGKSFVFTLFWLISMVGFAYGLFSLYQHLAADEEFVERVKETIQIFTES